ncbi:hypothetical protein O3P69_001977 [Scylla paramamosain]|uniref:Cadherin domain-containing protein n=1 Tax=Scylla paramamosain TaxID=85552 RepID=A0AAW0V0J8_SCYPA
MQWWRAAGWGWQLFGVRTEEAEGHVFPLAPLDYEDPRHAAGFSFLVQVTDRGVEGFANHLHIDSARVKLALLNINDNPPVFARPHAQLTLREDAHLGTLLATLPAHDPDEMKNVTKDYKTLYKNPLSGRGGGGGGGGEGGGRGEGEGGGGEEVVEVVVVAVAVVVMEQERMAIMEWNARVEQGKWN